MSRDADGASTNGDAYEEATTRERIRDLLTERDAPPSEIAEALGVGLPSVRSNVPHVARSVRSDEGARFLVAPPECADCGFSRFDDPLAAPSRCPSCKSERVEEAVFRIEEP